MILGGANEIIAREKELNAITTYSPLPADFRKHWGSHATLIAFFRVFMMQGLIMLLLAYPIIRVNSEQSGAFDLAAYLGLAVWIIGFGFQAIGDWQLRQFKRNRRDKEEVLTTGL